VSARPAAVSSPRVDGATRVLVTGDRGAVGVPVAGYLRRRGYEVAGFDLADGADVLDPAAVRSAAIGCAAIVHLAALSHDTARLTRGSRSPTRAATGPIRRPP
jgi:nucleoside-diphosphate-sugar epimerase